MIKKTLFWILAIVVVAASVALTYTALPLLFKAVSWLLAAITLFVTIQYQRTSKSAYEQAAFWMLAIVITVSTAIYQRLTGPTYPVQGAVELAGETITYSLPRSHGGEGDADINVRLEDQAVRGILHYKRHGVDEPFVLEEMIRIGDSLTSNLPHQMPAGKLEYFVELISGNKSVYIPGPQTVVIRFKGEVPVWALAPHVLLMFLGMLWSNRTGLEAFTRSGSTQNLTLWTTIILFAGGLIMGPVVQKHAFGSFWTGVPFGWDLTDNKTLIFVVIWALTLWRHRYNPKPRYFVLAAAIITFIMYMIPHSMMGSELDYTTGEVKTG